MILPFSFQLFFSFFFYFSSQPTDEGWFTDSSHSPHCVYPPPQCHSGQHELLQVTDETREYVYHLWTDNGSLILSKATHLILGPYGLRHHCETRKSYRSRKHFHMAWASYFILKSMLCHISALRSGVVKTIGVHWRYGFFHTAQSSVTMKHILSVIIYDNERWCSVLTDNVLG